MGRAAVEFADYRVTQTATIDSGSVTSSVVDLAGTRLVAMRFPLMTPSTAGFSFEASYDNGTTYETLTNNVGATYTVSSSGNAFIYLPPDNWQGIRHVRIIAGTTQTASKTISLVSTPL